MHTCTNIFHTGKGWTTESAKPRQGFRNVTAAGRARTGRAASCCSRLLSGSSAKGAAELLELAAVKPLAEVHRICNAHRTRATGGTTTPQLPRGGNTRKRAPARTPSLHARDGRAIQQASRFTAHGLEASATGRYVGHTCNDEHPAEVRLRHRQRNICNAQIAQCWQRAKVIHTGPVCDP